MRLYIFSSDAKKGLRAFASDIAGNKLPEQFRPWRAVGVVGLDKDPPHNLPRAEIEEAIESDGYKLWRMKPKAAQA